MESELNKSNETLSCRSCGCELLEDDYDSLCEDCSYEINQGEEIDPDWIDETDDEL